MNYRVDKRNGNKLSVLGFGCMRLPRTVVKPDIAKSEKLIVSAIARGINYFDCAYIYPGSEETLGTILARNGLRDKVYIATKLPPDRAQTSADLDQLLTTQLERLQTDHIDYYLMHNLTNLETWNRLCSIGIVEWLAQKKSAGVIRNVGFSSHASLDEFLKILDAQDWDFCQIQYNYININYQAGAVGLKKAAEKGMAVMIMEPLLGGRLAGNLPAKADALFRGVAPERKPADWALRWLWNQPEPTVVLSGMNSDTQLEENITLADEAEVGMLSQKDESVFAAVADAFNESYKIPCTGCNYCMPCPRGVNIPGCFASYNLSYAVGYFSGIQSYATGVGGFSPANDSSPDRCVRCKKCESHCPQSIAISDELQVVKKRMEPLVFRLVKRIMQRRRTQSK